ncbi:MAG: Sulfoxide reductase heme-binding subunit YedZ [candidate division WS6 bacterium OLB20]|uniref:Sulfoxide reductase heme-binding subunit YedZ n=1 Tax=candidate division WS6 bacterium OLB20 TaxID=1617426 RepID=A0A136LXQ5_9BACT|nr:MAG: Sulfoxide reductase heme-binding subunit YedZ [candidate division WS6 bacterium OLB20]
MQQILARNRRWIIATAFNYVLLITLAALNIQLAVKLAGYITILYLALTLIPVRLRGWRSFGERSDRILLQLQGQRRDFGISAAWVVILHALFAFYYYGGASVGVIDLRFYLTPAIAPGFLAEGFLLLLLITSHGYLKRRLGTSWKPLHRMIWIAVGLAVVHTFLAARSYTAENTGLAAVIILLTIIMTAVLDFIIRSRRGKETDIQKTSLAFLSLGIISAIILAVIL